MFLTSMFLSFSLSVSLPLSLKSVIKKEKKRKKRGWHRREDTAFGLAVRNLSPVLGPSVFRPCDLGQVTLSL